jgi:hypothetical protein
MMEQTSLCRPSGGEAVMDEKESTAEAADSPRRRRVPPPTIDLEATPVSPQAGAGADSPASESTEPPGQAPGQGPEQASSGEDMTAPEQAEKTTAPPPAGSGGSSRFWPLVGAGVLGAVIALVAASAAAWVLLGPGADHGGDADARLTRIESQLDALAHRNSAPAASTAPAPPADAKALGELTERLARIESQLSEQAGSVDREVKPLTDKLADLTHRNDEIMAAAQVARDRADAAAKSLADVARQLTVLNAERARAPQVQRADLDALSTRLAGVESATKSINEQLTRMASTGAGSTRQAVLAIALDAAVERGAPYARELAAIDSAAANAETLAALKPFAATGVPSAAALAHELTTLLPAARAAAGEQRPAGGFLARLQSNAERLMRVRPIGAAPGDDPIAILSRVDAKANQGDIKGALAEANKLSATVRAPLDPWIKRAEAREAALAAASALASHSLDEIRQPAPGTQGTAPQ